VPAKTKLCSVQKTAYNPNTNLSLIPPLHGITAFDIHDQQIFFRVSGNDNSFGGHLSVEAWVEHLELGAEEVVEQRGLAGGLRPDDRQDVVAGPAGGEVDWVQVFVEVRSAKYLSGTRGRRSNRLARNWWRCLSSLGIRLL
jgi:hypothetical protein